MWNIDSTYIPRGFPFKIEKLYFSFPLIFIYFTSINLLKSIPNLANLAYSEEDKPFFKK